MIDAAFVLVGIALIAACVDSVLCLGEGIGSGLSALMGRN